MKLNLSWRLGVMMVAVAGASALGTAITAADPPGYLFMDLDNNQALVVQKPGGQMTARILKQPAKLPDDLAAKIAAGAQPAGGGVIVVYKGQLHVLPDKMVEAGAPGHGE